VGDCFVLWLCKPSPSRSRCQRSFSSTHLIREVHHVQDNICTFFRVEQQIHIRANIAALARLKASVVGVIDTDILSPAFSSVWLDDPRWSTRSTTILGQVRY